jgi:hypothetical protein
LLAAFGVSTDRAGSFSVSGRGTDVRGDSYKILAMGRCTLPFFRHGIRLRLVYCFVGVCDQVDVPLADVAVILRLLLHHVLLFEILELLLG